MANVSEMRVRIREKEGDGEGLVNMIDTAKTWETLMIKH